MQTRVKTTQLLQQINSVRDEYNLNGLAPNKKLHNLAKNLKSKLKKRFCGRSFSSSNFQKYEVMCQTWKTELSKQENLNNLSWVLEKVETNDEMMDKILSPNMTDMGMSLDCSNYKCSYIAIVAKK